MKQLISPLIFLLLAFGCEKNPLEGPTGEQGLVGKQGIQGTAGEDYSGITMQKWSYEGSYEGGRQGLTIDFPFDFMSSDVQIILYKSTVWDNGERWIVTSGDINPDSNTFFIADYDSYQYKLFFIKYD